MRDVERYFIQTKCLLSLCLIAPTLTALRGNACSRRGNVVSVSTVFGIAVEPRKSRRYRLQAPVSFLWERPDGQLQQGKGTIRDISDRGVFVTGDLVPERGAHLDMDVYLPSLEVGGAAVKLHGEGTVIRVDKEGVPRGFAATVAFQTEAASGPTVVNPRRLH
jgi:hypothetical protein